jgi:hypothetical protein
MNITNTTDYDTPFRSSVSTGIGILGLFSCLSDATIISLIFCFKLHRQLHTRLVIYLCMSDFLQGLAGVSSLGWIHRVPQIGDSLCTFQSLMFQVGDLASAIASAFIGVFIWSNVHSFTLPWLSSPGTKFEMTAVGGTFGIPILFAFIAWFRQLATGIPIYTPVGFHSWCWVSELYPVERLMLHYTWIFLVCLLLFFLYIYLIVTLRKNTFSNRRPSQAQKAARKKQNLVRKMMGFPIIFFTAFVPLGLERFVTAVSSGNVQFPDPYVAFAICIFVSNGLLNACLYGFTRKLFHKVKTSIESTNSEGKSDMGGPAF